MTAIEQLQKQIGIVIQMLNDRISSENSKRILYTLLDRYKRADEIIKENGDINKITILGGCRAYLDAYSDYMNPILCEMDKAEEMLKNIMLD